MVLFFVIPQSATLPCAWLSNAMDNARAPGSPGAYRIGGVRLNVP